MAVQAQYPSNVLPFHRTTDPEMKKMMTNTTGFGGDVEARQIQQGPSGFMDHNHALFFSSGVVGAMQLMRPASNLNSNDISSNHHPRKRAREAAVAAGVGAGGGLLSTTMVLPGNGNQVQQHSAPAAEHHRGLLVPAQPMLPQLLMTSSHLGGGGPSQVHTQRRQAAEQLQQEEVPISLVSTGLRLSLEDQPVMQQPQRSSSVVVPPLSDDLAAHIKQHREEIDRLILVQGEHLHRSIAESRRRHIRNLVSAAEESASRKLREKQSEIDRASCTRSDLEARAARLGAEVAAWKSKARAGDAAAAALRAQLDRVAADLAQQQAHHPKAGGGSGATDGERGGSDAASACVDPRREEMERQQQAAAATASTSSRPPLASGSPVPCRQCGSAGASVVLLPCRHLCLCASCSHAEALPAVCPVCFCARSVAVEVFFC